MRRYVFLSDESFCSCDLHVISLNNTLNRNKLTVVYLTQHMVFGW